MGHIEGSDREQITLFPEALDDYVSQENPVRFIDAFVQSIDLEELGFTHAVPNELGRPPYNPADLLRLFVYGCLNRVRSSRQLEREANVGTEMSLSVLAYDLLRAINILGVPTMIRALA